MPLDFWQQYGPWGIVCGILVAGLVALAKAYKEKDTQLISLVTDVIKTNTEAMNSVSDAVSEAAKAQCAATEQLTSSLNLKQMIEDALKQKNN